MHACLLYTVLVLARCHNDLSQGLSLSGSGRRSMSAKHCKEDLIAVRHRACRSSKRVTACVETIIILD